MCFRWESPFLLSDVLFQNVSLNSSAQFSRFQTLSLCNANIHRGQNRCWSIDCHTGADLLQRYAIENDLHVFQRAHRHTATSDLALSPRTIGIIPIESRHVECDAQTRLSMFQQVVQTFVGIFRSSEAGEHAHRPWSSPVHRRVYATDIGILAWKPDLLGLVQMRNIFRSVDSFYRNIR